MFGMFVDLPADHVSRSPDTTTEKWVCDAGTGMSRSRVQSSPGIKPVGVREYGLPGFARAGIVRVTINRDKIPLLSAEDIHGLFRIAALPRCMAGLGIGASSRQQFSMACPSLTAKLQ